MAIRAHVDDGRVPGVRRIAVLRANAIGDFVFALPALTALRNAYPQARIVLLARAWHARFLAARPGPVDRVIVLPGIPGVTLPPAAPPDPAAAACIDALGAARFDLALQWHGGGRYSNPLVLRLGARVSAGLRSADAPALDRNLDYLPWRNERLRLLEAAALVGAPASVLAPSLAVTQADRAAAAAILPPRARALAILQPGATDPRRRWPVPAFAEVGDWLVRRGFDVAINGSDEEAALLRSVQQAMRETAHVVIPELGALAGLLERAALVVANDTGPLHLAEALGTATVAIYWCGNALVSTPLIAARHRAAIAWRVDCPVCGMRNIEERCSHDASFVADVRVDEVLGHVRALLDAALPRPAARAAAHA
jgi:ADP-heptose:LPS heptosyltransferase